MVDVKKSEPSEKEILEKLDHELDEMIEQLAGTEMDHDPAIEEAAVEATLLPEDADDE